MQAELNPQAPSLVLELSVPTSPLERGGFAIDPMPFLLGQSLDSLLSPVLEGPPTPGTAEKGRPTLIYTLSIPPNYGLMLSLPRVGEVGIFNDAGYLRIQARAELESFIHAYMADLLAAGPLFGYSGDPNLLDAWLRLEPGMQWATDVPLLGQVVLAVK